MTMLPKHLKSLLHPSAYPVLTVSVELVQTHVSWIFLTETHAFKLKKPVNFGFLDFSTIDRRRFYCDEEVRLNRRLCPDIYERVIELRDTADGAAFHGSGPIIDHAVMMKRLPADGMLDKLVEKGAVSNTECKQVAEVISTFHAQAATTPYISTFGSIDRIMLNWRENFEQISPYEASTLPAVDREVIRSWVTSFATDNAFLFTRRIEQGFIRDCDGDLHLENICLVNDKIYIFDCIEFNERFRFSDTAADIAFLLMDLDYHGRGDLADSVQSNYIEASGDAGLLAMVDFYKVYRAFVRGKVSSMQSLDAGSDPDTVHSAQMRAIRYFRLARGYIERNRLSPTLFVTCGTMGCGKSTLARQFSFELGIALFNSDAIRKQHAGISPETPVHEQYGQGLYDQTASVETYRTLEQLAESELAVGRSVLIDASFRSSSTRARFARLAKRHRAAFVILMISCDNDEQEKRIHQRALSGASISDGRIELLERQRADFIPPSSSEGKIIPVTTIGSPESIMNRIYEELHP